MDKLLTEEQRTARRGFKAFVDKHVVPFADQFDLDERLPQTLIHHVADAGYWGAGVPVEHGGLGLDTTSHGLLCEQFGRASISLLSILTVQGMVSEALLRWGSPSQRQDWVGPIARGESMAAFALSEPDIGSDAKHVQTTAEPSGDGFVLNGDKKWISGGLLADVYLVVAQCEGQPGVFLVERTTPGLLVQPIGGLLGFRSAMLAELHFEQCAVPADALVGRVGFGFSHVAGSALDHGRFCVAWGSVGLAQACVEACMSYTEARVQFGRPIRDHQLIQQLVADMVTDTQAARMLCYGAARSRQEREPAAIMETSMAKYFASRVAARAGGDAVQIHGANGCSSDYPVQRYLRDGKILEIIEGSNQIQQMLIARHAYQLASGL